VTSTLVEPLRAPNLAPQHEGLPELDSGLLTTLRVCSITGRTRLMRSQGCQRRASFNLAGSVSAFPLCLAVLFGSLLAPTTFDRDPYVHNTGPRGTRLTGRRRGSGGSARCSWRAAGRHR
jgi:hypothetical protein